MAGGTGTLLTGLLDALLTHLANQRAEERMQQGVGMLGASMDEIRELLGQSTGPAWTWGGETFGRQPWEGWSYNPSTTVTELLAPSATGEQVLGDIVSQGSWYGPTANMPGNIGQINLDELFQTGAGLEDKLTGILDEYQPTTFTKPDFSGYDTGYDQLSSKIQNLLGGTRADVGDVLGGAKGDISDILGSSLARTAAWSDVDWMPFEGQARRSSALQDIGRQSAARTQIAKENAVARGLAMGRGLQEISSYELPAQQFEEAGLRTSQALSKMADIEQKELEHSRTQAGMQLESGLAQRANIAALDTAEAQALRDLAGVEAGAARDIGITQADRLADIGIRGGELGQERMIRESELGLETEKATADQALRILSERLGAALAGTSQMSADELNRFQAGLSMLGREDALTLALAQALLSGTGMQANLLAGYQEMIPQFSPLWQAYQASNQPSQKESSSFSILGSGFGSGCVDGQARIPMADGSERALSEIEVGDEIIGGDGTIRRVLRQEYGSVPKNDKVGHLQIRTGAGRMLRLTADHKIDGKRADEYRPGDDIPVEEPGLGCGWDRIASVHRCDYVHSGDLMLEDDAPYVANGIVVDSTIGKYSEEEWQMCLGVNPWAAVT